MSVSASVTAELETVERSRVSDDGRRLRRDRNRDAVVDAMLAMFEDGHLAPSSDEIAARAGLSPRSLFRYFDDIDDLVRAAISRQVERVRPQVDIDVRLDAPFEVRVAALVEQRLRLFDAVAAVGLVTRMRAPFQPLLQTQLTQGRAFLRGQIKRLFAMELADLGPEIAATSLAVIDVVCSFESYRLMRDDQQLSRVEAGDAFAHALAAMFAPSSRATQS